MSNWNMLLSKIRFIDLMTRGAMIIVISIIMEITINLTTFFLNIIIMVIIIITTIIIIIIIGINE